VRARYPNGQGEVQSRLTGCLDRVSLVAMKRATLVSILVAGVSMVAAVWLWLDNRALRREAAELRAAAKPAAADPWATSSGSAATADTRADLAGVPRGLGGAIDGVDAPKLPDAPKETRMERRARRQQEIAAMLGRLDGETDEEYRARILPLLEMGLSRPRENVADMRRQAEELAGVTPQQREKLDTAFNKVYDDLIDYTNQAVQDGQLTPYERNVAGILDYAGGLGAILNNAETQVGGILSPQQVKTMTGAGFEWAEYLGVSAPWERLQPPPPAPGGS